MTFNHINRRTHLYLALALMPWFLMYGVSSIAFSHHDPFDKYYKDGVPDWTTRLDKNLDLEIPEGTNDRKIGGMVLESLGMEGAYGTYGANANRFNIFCHDFWNGARLTYYRDSGRVIVEDRRFRWDHFLTGLHARGGFQQDSFLDDLWAGVVDLVCVGFILWVASGIYMWWMLPQSRRWGFIALGGGFLTFAIFLIAL